MASRPTCVLLHAFQDRFTHEFFIQSAYPERALVEAVLRNAAPSRRRGGRRAARTRRARTRWSAGSRATARSTPRCASWRRTASLSSGGDGNTRLIVRLLATPDRIERELGRRAPNGAGPAARAVARGRRPLVRRRARSTSTGCRQDSAARRACEAFSTACRRGSSSTWERAGSGLASGASGRPTGRPQHRLGERSSGVARPIWPSSTPCRNTRTLTAAVAGSCFDISATPPPDRAAMRATTAWARTPSSRRRRPARTTEREPAEPRRRLRTTVAAPVADDVQLGKADAALLGELKALRGTNRARGKSAGVRRVPRPRAG